MKHLNIKASGFLFGFILCFIGLTLSVHADDIDEDGVDDALEAQLINSFRPQLHYDSRNTIWPATVLWYVQQCTLREDDTVRIDRSIIKDNPLLILTGRSSDGQASHDGYYSSNESRWKLDPAVDRNGQGTNDTYGMYAHCFRITKSYYYQQRADIAVGQPGDYVIQYWQFFPYNDHPDNFPIPGCCDPWCPGLCDWGDHDGDWEYLDVFVDGTTLSLKNIVYHHHGDDNCAVDILPGQFPLPADNIPQCYLEPNTHEWWPLPQADDCFTSTFTDVPNGQGWTVRSSNIKNIGERFRPSSDIEAQIIVLFNGLWGRYAGDQFATPADSPLYQEDLLPPGPTDPGFLVAPRWVVHMSPTGLDDSSIPKHLGSVFSPSKKLDQAAQVAEPQGTIRCQAGVYSVGTGVAISRPVTVMTDGSGTVIFQ